MFRLVLAVSALLLVTTVSANPNNISIDLAQVTSIQNSEVDFNAWGFGAVLSRTKNYIKDLSFDLLGAWQAVYLKRLKLETFISAKSTEEKANGTLKLTMTGKYRRWQYSAVVSVAAFFTNHSDDAHSTVLLPLTCGVLENAGIANTTVTACNVLMGEMMFQSVRATRPLADAGYAQLLDCYGSCSNYVNESVVTVKVGGMRSALSPGQISQSPTITMIEVPINITDFVPVLYNPLGISEREINATMWGFKSLTQIAGCSDENNALIRFPGMLVDGVVLYCAFWNGLLVGTTWRTQWEWGAQQIVDCNLMTSVEAFGVIMYPVYQGTNGEYPYQSIFVFEMNSSTGQTFGNPKCRVDTYDIGNSRSKLGNGVLWYGMDVNLGSINVGDCDLPQDFNFSPYHGINISLKMETFYNQSDFYTDISMESMLEYHSIERRENTTKYGAVYNSDVCAYGDESLSLHFGKAGIGGMLQLALNSVGGVEHLSSIESLVSSAEENIQQCTIVLSLMAVISAIGSAIGVYAVQLKCGWFKLNGWILFPLRILLCIIEMCTINIAVIAQMVTLSKVHKQELTSMWIDELLNVDSIDTYAATKVILSGAVPHGTEQWLVLGIGFAVSVLIIFHRWFLISKSLKENESKSTDLTDPDKISVGRNMYSRVI